jgi:hypothetical protein
MPEPQATHDGSLGFLGMLMDDPCRRSSSAEYVLAKTADSTERCSIRFDGYMKYSTDTWSILCKGITTDGYMQKVVFTSEVCTWPRPVKGFVSKFRPRVSCPMFDLSTQKCAESPHARSYGDKDDSTILVPTIVLRADMQHVSATSGSARAPLTRPELLWIDRVVTSSVCRPRTSGLNLKKYYFLFEKKIPSSQKERSPTLVHTVHSTWWWHWKLFAYLDVILQCFSRWHSSHFLVVHLPKWHIIHSSIIVITDVMTFPALSCWSRHLFDFSPKKPWHTMINLFDFSPERFLSVSFPTVSKTLSSYPLWHGFSTDILRKPVSICPKNQRPCVCRGFYYVWI